VVPAEPSAGASVGRNNSAAVEALEGRTSKEPGQEATATLPLGVPPLVASVTDSAGWAALAYVVARALRYAYHYAMVRPELQRQRIVNRWLRQQLKQSQPYPRRR
jgi:hypothetical protein